MAIKSKPCLICGKPFKPCATITDGLNWRRDFCSPECCQEHIRRKEAAKIVVVEPEVIVDEVSEEVVKPSRKSSKKEKTED